MTAPRKFVAILAALLLGGVAGGATRGADIPVDLELVLAADISRSIDDDEHALQREGYAAALTSPELMRAIQAGVLRAIAVTFVEWAGEGEQDVVVSWTVIRDTATAAAVAKLLREKPREIIGSTSISSAIDFGMALFDGNGIEGTRRVIDVSGDGINVSGRPVESARDDAVARGVTVNGLPIVNDRPSRPPWPEPPIDTYYRDHVIGGPGAFYLVVRSFASFGEFVRRKLIREIVGREVPPRFAAAGPAGSRRP